MIHTNPSGAVTSLLWVEVTGPDITKHWARTSRIMTGASQTKREQTLERLKAGQQVGYEASGFSIQCPPMASSDQKRLAHLTTFEECGFSLTMFRSDAALFYRNGQDYYCLREMVERGFLPTPTIAINRLNTPVTTVGGRLLDVFVPVGMATVNFFSSYASRP